MDYPAKILLFGEYGIILDSMALAIPYPRFSGEFRFSNGSTGQQSKREVESNEELKKLLCFFKNDVIRFNFINFEHFEDEVNQGLYFDSSIPIGSGLGSSGALTAALYERYLIKTHSNEIQLIKTNLSFIESYFHGKSSGIDPLISLLKKPVLIEDDTSFITGIGLSSFFSAYTLFLINSHSKGNTGTLVSLFLEKYQNQHFKKNIDNEYIPLINQTIKAVVNADYDLFETLITSYSKFQLSHFEEMIPLEMKTHFENGINSGNFHLKLCGSGGGGFILGIAHDRLKAESYFNLNYLEYTVV